MTTVQRKLVVTADTSGLSRGAAEVQRFGQSVMSASQTLEAAKGVMRPEAFKAFAASMQPAIDAEKAMAKAAGELEGALRPVAVRLNEMEAAAQKTAATAEKRSLSEARAAEALRLRYDAVYRDAKKYATVEQDVARQVLSRNLTVEQGNTILAGAASRFTRAGSAMSGANDNMRNGLAASSAGLDRWRRSLGMSEEQLDRMRGRLAATGAALSEFRMLAVGAAGAIGLGGAFAVSGIIDTATEFQKLGASLKTVTGSSEAAERAFDFIRQFAAETPYTLQEVTESFIKLQSLGLDPSRASLEAYGNTASAMGKPIMQFIEAVADAVTGENERLKEFGIRASVDGEKVAYTFQGVTKTIGNNAQEIEAYLKSIGQVQFGGAMAEQMKILPGVFGNAQDAIANFQNAIGEGGLSAAVQDAASDLTDFLNANDNLARSIGAIAGGVLSDFRSDFSDLASEMTEVSRWTQATAEVFGSLMSTFSGAGTQITGVSQGMVAGAEGFASAWNASGRIIYDVLNSIIGAGVGAYQSIIATWEQLPAAFSGLAKAAGNALVAGLETAVNGSIAGINSLIASINSVAPEFAQMGTFAPISLDGFKASLSDAETATAKTIGSIMSAAQATDYLGAGMDALSAPIANAMGQIRDAKARLDGAATASKDLGTATKLTGEGFQIAAGAASGAGAAIDGGITKPTKEATKALREADAARKALFGEADSAVEQFFPMVAAEAEAERLRGLIGDTGNGLSDLQRQALGMKIDQGFRSAREAAEDLRSTTNGLEGAFQDAGEIGRDAFEGIFDALTGGGDVLDSLMGSLAAVGGPIGNVDDLFEGNAE